MLTDRLVPEDAVSPILFPPTINKVSACQSQLTGLAVKMFVLCLVIVYNVYSLQSVVGQTMPKSPCPGVFHYEFLDWLPKPGDMALKGVITVDSPLPIILTVRMQIPALLTSKYRGRLELAEDKHDLIQRINDGTLQKIKFNLFYPGDSPLPQLILIKVNDRVLCSSTPPPRRIKTNLSLEYTLKTVTSNNPHVGNNNSGNKRWHYEDFFKPNDRQPQTSQPVSNHGGKYYQNPFMNFPMTQKNEPTERDRPNNNRYENAPDITFVDVSNNPYSHNLFLDTIANALKSDSQKPFQALPTFQSNTPNPHQNPILMSDTCGKSFGTNPLIVNGTRARRGEWPWLVALFKRVELGVLFVCGSTLISNQYLLTAAHCVNDYTDSANKEGLFAHVGRFNLRDWGEQGSEPREISNIFIHPDYKSDLVYSDIALLKLQTSVTVSPYVNPACMWTGEEDPSLIVGSKGIVVGWGMDGRGHKVTETPNVVTLPIVSKEKCLDSKIDFKFYASNKTFCAGFRDGSGPCNGDSGGGLLMPRTDSNGNVRWYLRGIVSLSLPKNNEGVYECDLSQYLIFTDVAKFRNWLSEYIPLGR